MAKAYNYVYLNAGELLLELIKHPTDEEKGRFIMEVVECVIRQNKGVNSFADQLMSGVDDFREDCRRRKEESKRRKEGVSDDNFMEEIPEPEATKPAKKPEMKKEAFGTIAGKVRLTSEQYINLSGVYGDKLGAAIDILDEYLVNGGKIARNYKDHSLVMKKGGWVYNRVFGLDNRNGGNAKSFRQMDQERAAQICRENFPEVMELYGLNDPEN